MTILIVDDHATFRAEARALLEADGLVVAGEAADGASAIALCRVLEPDIVLLDIGLPDLDGLAVAKLLVEDGARHRPRVVLTSSREASVYGARLVESPSAGFIPKDELSGDAIRALVGDA